MKTKRGHVTLNIPLGLELAMVNLHTKFQMPVFTHSKVRMYPQNLKALRATKRPFGVFCHTVARICHGKSM